MTNSTASGGVGDTFASHLYCLVDCVQRGEPFDYPLGNARPTLMSDGGTPRLSWQFDSLKSAIDVLLVTELTAERRRLRLCKRCGKPFKVKNPKTEYCGATCRNGWNVKMSRARKLQR